jgi:uncharacterized protein YbjT (DUF2867 family)
MKDPVLEQMRQWLPELFGTSGKAPKPGGMCTPEAGCPPAADGTRTDIIGMLTGSGAVPPAEKQIAGEKEAQNKDSEKEIAMIAITGATGNIGSKIAAALLSGGHPVRCIARSTDKLDALAAQGAEVEAISLADTRALTQAFSGAEAVFAMIPPNYQAPDFLSYQEMIGTSLARAIQASGVKYVVNLSSLGAHLADGTGPIKGLHAQEQRLNELPGVHLLHLRPTYFMENLLANIPLIQTMNIMGSALRADLPLPMIATRDIAAVAALRLAKKDFAGQGIVDLLGQRDLSMEEIARIVGRKIDRPDLKYVQFAYPDTRKAMLDMGFSDDVAGLFIEMSRAFNEGLVQGTRTPGNTTETAFEDFAQIFVQILFGR